MTTNTLRRLGLLTLVSLAASVAQAAEDPLGRLFSSPRERALMDQGRQKFSKNSPVSKAPVEEQAEQAADQFTLDGYVRQSGGKITAWINQTPQHGQENPQGITLLKTGSQQSAVSMQLPSGKRLHLKAGQTFEVTRGKVTEVYQEAALPLPHESAK